MAGAVDVEEQAILNGILQDPAYAGYATLYIGLSSTTPTEAGANVTEPSAGAYARVSTTGTDWGAATGTAPATKSNTAVKTFPTATADWLAGVNLTHFVLFDAPTAGNVKWWGALGTAKPVLNGDTPSFAAGALVLKLGDPTDTY
ncbi:MAG: phage tail fiber protein [Actinophytocola sp.]|uniref:phage tail fiber protein n=1 Tax=Actinophytocola sp. TaxID=1872138 RepID=UPI003D6AC2D5